MEFLYNDRLEPKGFSEIIKESFLHFRFHFEPADVIKQTMDTVLLPDGVYLELPSQNTID